MTTWFGGMPWVPSALRVNPSTMTIRVKAVTMMSIAGSRLTRPSISARPIGLEVARPRR